MDNARLIVGAFNLDLPIDFGIQITKEIADVRDPGKRNSDWSQSFVLPGSKINKKAFTHLFDLNTTVRNTSLTNFNPDYNPNLKAPASLYVDEVLQIKGFIRLVSINTTDANTIEFNCTLHGQLADIFTTISDALLSELDFTEYNHTLAVARISESWAGTIQKNSSPYANFAFGVPKGEGYLYGLIDDGSIVNYYGDSHVAQWYPQLYAKEVVDKIFAFAGYTYTTDSFFNSETFKRLTVPPPGTLELNAQSVEDRLFEAKPASGQAITTTTTTINFATETFDNSNQFANPKFTSSKDGAHYDFFFYNNGTITGLAAATAHTASFRLYKNGVYVIAVIMTFTTDGGGNFTFNSTGVFTDIILNNGEYIELKMGIVTDFAGIITGWTYTTSTTSKLYNGVVTNSWGNGSPVDFDSFFQGNDTQKDFLKSFFTMFNLYAEPDPDYPTKLFIQTRESFYNTTTRDWTKKLDYLQPLEIIPMGELNANPYYFTYADGDDLENKDYKETFDRIYGDKKYFIDNDFISEEKKIDIAFAPSQFRKLTGWDKYLTVISTKENGGTGKLRCLYFPNTLGCNSYGIYDNDNMTGTFTTKTEYPLTLHIDNVSAPSLDLSFGMPRRVGLPADVFYPNNNLFNKYWSKYITEITSKDSKIVAGYFQITPADMEKLSFRDLYYFENNYFRLNKIENYNPLIPGLFRCEFLFLSIAPDFTPTDGTSGEFDSYGGEFYPSRITKKQFNGSELGQPALITGRNNFGGLENLFVSDRSGIEPGARLVTALGSYEVNFYRDAHASTAINSSGQTITLPNKLMIQNAYVEMNPTTNGFVLRYDSGANKWVGAADYSKRTVYNKSASDSPITISEAVGEVFVFVDATIGNTIVNLPAAAGNLTKITVKKIDATANYVRLDGNGAETIDGAATVDITTLNGKLTVVSDNTNFKIIA